MYPASLPVQQCMKLTDDAKEQEPARSHASHRSRTQVCLALLGCRPIRGLRKELTGVLISNWLKRGSQESLSATRETEKSVFAWQLQICCRSQAQLRTLDPRTPGSAPLLQFSSHSRNYQLLAIEYMSSEAEQQVKRASNRVWGSSSSQGRVSAAGVPCPTG